jgi:putative transposase
VVYLYQSAARDNTALVMRMKEITQTRVHYGYRRVHVMLKREGFKDNHKRVYRLYKEQGLTLRHKRPKRNKAVQLRQPKSLAQSINHLFDGRKLSMLTVVPLINVDKSGST